MNRRKIEELIPDAMKFIEEKRKKGELCGKKSQAQEIDRKFKGYIDGMGPSMILAGMRQTICFYSEKKEKADRDRIIQLLEKLLGIESLKNTATNPRMSSEEYRKLRDRLMEGIVALKLALKTFSIAARDEGGNDDD